MKIIPVTHYVIGKLALISLLSSTFALTPCFAVELVGRPVAVGESAAVVNVAPAAGDVEAGDVPANETQAVTQSAASVSASGAPIASNESAALATAPNLCTPMSTQQGSDELRRAINELRDTIHHNTVDDFGDLSLGPDTIVPVVAMLLLFGGPILLLIVLAILHYRAKARRQQNLNMNIDKLLASGRDIPLEMLLGEDAAPKASVQGSVLSTLKDDHTLQKGVRNIGLGTGWLVFLTIMFDIDIGSFGFIFIGLGISQLVIWKLSSTGAISKPDAPETFKAQD